MFTSLLFCTAPYFSGAIYPKFWRQPKTMKINTFLSIQLIKLIFKSPIWEKDERGQLPILQQQFKIVTIYAIKFNHQIPHIHTSS